MTVVARRVVDEHTERTVRPVGLGDRLLQRRNIADVAMRVAQRGRIEIGMDALRERTRRAIVDVDERDAAPLGGELRDERGTDSRRAARNEHRQPGEVRIARRPVRCHFGGAGNVT